MINHSKRLCLKGDSARLTFRADAFWPLRVPRGAVGFHSVVRLTEGRHEGRLELGFVGRGVNLPEVGMKGEVLDLPLCEVFSGIGFERHAVVAHPFCPMSAHFLIY